jgi:prepilin-type N-terminal cleavage/methylation domain-containing protein
MVPKNCKESGFSLIEVAIALLVISILMLPMIYMWNQYLVMRKVTDTKVAIGRVESALIKYYAKNNRYPLPEDPNVAIGSVAAGKESSTIPVACTIDPATICTTAVNAYTVIDAGASAYIGTVPYAALGIPFKSAIDGYGNKLTYAVTQKLTVTATFDENIGGIEVYNDAGVSVYDIAPRSLFFVASHGENAEGARGLSGALVRPCGVALDNENCDGDALFRNNYSSTHGKNVIQNNFDDYSATSNRTSLGRWLSIAGTTEIRSGNSGNVLINGGNSGIASSKLTVIDNGGSSAVAAVTVTGKIKTRIICKYWEDNCKDPQDMDINYIPGVALPGTQSADQLVGAPPEGVGIGMLEDGVDLNPANTWDSTTYGHKGAGIRCTGGRGLKGIKHINGAHMGILSGTDETCYDHTQISVAPARITNSGSCPLNEFPTGITFDNMTDTLSLICAPYP